MTDPVFARVRLRIVATVVDLVLVLAVSSMALLAVPNAFAVVMGELPSSEGPPWLPLLGAIPSVGFPVYSALGVLLTRGRTLGMALTGIAVTGAYGERPTRARLAWRGVVGTAVAWATLLAMSVTPSLAAPFDDLGELVAQIPVPVLRQMLATVVFVTGMQVLLAPVALWLMALLWAHFDERGRTWQDLAAATTVVAL